MPVISQHRYKDEWKSKKGSKAGELTRIFGSKSYGVLMIHASAERRIFVCQEKGVAGKSGIPANPPSKKIKKYPGISGGKQDSPPGEEEHRISGEADEKEDKILRYEQKGSEEGGESRKLLGSFNF